MNAFKELEKAAERLALAAQRLRHAGRKLKEAREAWETSAEKLAPPVPETEGPRAAFVVRAPMVNVLHPGTTTLH